MSETVLKSGKIISIEKRLNTKDICEIYSITPKTLYMWITNLKMPHRKIGKYNYFVLSELQDWEDKFKYPVKTN